jgi:D-arabinose 1-dehydrogenase-like Zn-dependent alcohol dehydrogenase
MYCEHARFPGLNADGGFADSLLTNERALVHIPLD